VKVANALIRPAKESKGVLLFAKIFVILEELFRAVLTGLFLARPRRGLRLPAADFVIFLLVCESRRNIDYSVAKTSHAGTTEGTGLDDKSSLIWKAILEKS